MTKETKHTRGPWAVNAISMGTIEAADGTAVGQAFQVRPLREDIKQTERQANAQLMAASPELLAALERLVNIGNATPTRDFPQAAMQARAAIAKATGAAPHD